MISESPEFEDALDHITRVGRSVGVNLLLAAQRPIGVTDQMRANMKYRICLRVEGTDTSREMLRRSDAAFLPGGLPGRGYLQVGSERIELMQAAYSGDVYPYSLDDGLAPKDGHLAAADAPRNGDEPEFGVEEPETLPAEDAPEDGPAPELSTGEPEAAESGAAAEGGAAAKFYDVIVRWRAA